MSEQGVRSSEKVLSHPLERKAALQLADDLCNCFSWDKTPQGFDYWQQVANNLRVLAGENPSAD